MNDREKKLLFFLLFAVFIIANLFAYLNYAEFLQKKEIAKKQGDDELFLKKAQLEDYSKRKDEADWLAKHMPAKGTHASIRADLVTFIEKSLERHRVTIKKGPIMSPENPEETGDFRRAVVALIVECKDPELYGWLCELQNPKEARSITRLKITPKEKDVERLECELEITKWFTPLNEDDMEAAEK